MGTDSAGSANDHVVEVVRHFGWGEFFEQILVVVNLNRYDQRIPDIFGALEYGWVARTAKFFRRVHFDMIPVNAAVEEASRLAIRPSRIQRRYELYRSTVIGVESGQVEAKHVAPFVFIARDAKTDSIRTAIVEHFVDWKRVNRCGTTRQV